MFLWLVKKAYSTLNYWSYFSTKHNDISKTDFIFTYQPKIKCGNIKCVKSKKKCHDTKRKLKVFKLTKYIYNKISDNLFF